MIGSAIRGLVKHRFLVVAVTAVIALLGIIAYRNLIIDVFPDPSPALVTSRPRTIPRPVR